MTKGQRGTLAKTPAFERTLRGLNDYDTAWTWTLAMTQEERASRFAAVLKANGK
ncbi:MAG TPA: hypothetical protein VJM31_01235 [Vicinamibacterales bacterium]|nr:hypothetical protein [Vicinamibacterales bacterium]